MNTPLNINDYAGEVNLHKAFNPPANINSTKEELVDTLLNSLQSKDMSSYPYPEKRRMLHALQNVMEPFSFSEEEIRILDQLLQLELKDKVITDAISLTGNAISIGKTELMVWQGDITTLKVDAIVNAANNMMLGCRQPLHACIDNAIHTAAGMQLRDDCDVIMQKQGFAEPTGIAKVTRAYNLPSKFVLHTVGPIVQGAVTPQHETLLAGCYNSCLEIGKSMEQIRSIAFCGISTGVFGYPAAQAAQVAFKTVTEWIKKNPDALDVVVFNVFGDKDRNIYETIINKQ